jgi:hypothetical protein
MADQDEGLCIPPEIWDILLGLLDFRAVAALGATCRLVNNVMRAQTRFAFGKVRLSPMQAHIRDRATRMPDAEEKQKNVFLLHAPMGFGKTITGLSLAFANPDDGHRYVYVVPPKAFDTWVREAAKVFGTKSNTVTARTCVLFAHSSVATHKRYIDKALERAQDGILTFGPAVRAIVTSTTSRFGTGVATRWGTRIVVDEAHASTNLTISNLAQFRWAVRLSANTMSVESTLGEVLWGRVDVSTRCMDGSIPLVVLHRSLVQPYVTGDFNEARGFTPPAYKVDSIAKNLDTYMSALTFIFAEVPRGQIAMYLPDGETGDAIANALPSIAVGWELISFVNATSKIRLFESLDRSVLVIRLNKSEAINIRASHLVIVRPDWVNPIRYAQLVGRVLRPTNSNKEAAVFLVVPRGVPAHRVAYYDALRRLIADDLQLGIPDHRPSEFEKADACLRLCGSSLDCAAPTEVVAAVGIAFDSPEAVPTILARWLQEKAPSLSAQHMYALLGLPAPTLPALAAPAARSAATAGASAAVAGAPSAALSERELDELLGLA